MRDHTHLAKHRFVVPGLIAALVIALAVSVVLLISTRRRAERLEKTTHKLAFAAEMFCNGQAVSLMMQQRDPKALRYTGWEDGWGSFCLRIHRYDDPETRHRATNSSKGTP